MQARHGLTQRRLAPVGIVADGRPGDAGEARGPGGEGGTGIQELRWPAVQPCGDRFAVAAMAQVDAHPDSR